MCMQRIIDFHSHILPGADHGCTDVREALLQLRIARRFGTTDIVATPHFEPENDTVSSFLERRQAAADRLLPYLTAEMPRVFVGAEVLLCEGMEKMPDLEKLTVTGTKLLLLERPFLPLTDGMAETIAAIRERGFDVLLAHVDRYKVQETCRVLYPGVWAQLNSEALTSMFTRKKWLRFCYDGMVGAVGSDLHGVPQDYNAFGKLPRIMKDEFFETMTVSERLLSDAIPLPVNAKNVN